MVVDLHHHLETLHLLVRLRAHKQGHILGLEEHCAEETKTILSVPLYVNFYQGYGHLKKMITNIKDHIKRLQDSGIKIVLIEKKSDLDQDFSMGIVLHIESARCLKKFDQQLPELFELGVRGVIPLHYIDNHLGNSCDDPFRRFDLKKRDAGITKKGIAFVNRCNELGIWLDLTHTSEKTGEDFLDLAQFVVVSHIGIRELINSKRNKTLDFCKRVAQKGGVIGLSPWLYLTRPDYFKALEFVKENGLSENVCIGSDFGAPISTQSEIKGIYDMARISQDEDFSFKNALDFFKRVLPQ